MCEFSCCYLSFFSFLQRLSLSLLGRLAGSDRERLWKQAEMGAPEDSPDEREEMEVALQQVGLDALRYSERAFPLGSNADAKRSTLTCRRRAYRWFSLYQVCANLMEYCQTLLLQSSTQAQFSICLFSPSASEPAGRDGGRAGQSRSGPTGEDGKKMDWSLHIV